MRRISLACAACFLLFTAAAWGSVLGFRGVEPQDRSAAGSREAVLFGHRVVLPAVDKNAPGLARAFAVRGRMTGKASSISVYLDRGSGAKSLVAAVYANANGKPGARLTTGSLAGARPGGWDAIKVAAARVKSGSMYWLVLLAHGGSLELRTGGPSCADARSYARRLKALPLRWPGGTGSDICQISAFASGKRTRKPTTTTFLNTVGTAGTGLLGGLPILGSPGSAGGPSTPPTGLPVNIAAPTISGGMGQGQTLSTTNGSWLESPTSFSYQWERCSPGCSAISGANSSTYTLLPADVGDVMDVIVTAHNSFGSASQASTPTEVVIAPGGQPVPANFYVSESSTGNGTGSDCNNTLPYTWFNNPANWGIGASQIGPGMTVALCGTISSALQVSGSGTSINPITVVWEPGATLSAGAWNGPAIDTNQHSYIKFNGENNGTSIQATQDGTGLADQGVDSQGFSALDCTGCTFEDLTFANLYKHTSTSDTSVNGDLDNAIRWSGSNVTIADNTMHDIAWAMWDYGSNGDTNNQVYGNNIYNVDHGIAVAPAGTSLGTLFIFDNHVHDYANWDTTADKYHHDGLHCFYGGDGVTFGGFYIYNNRFDGTGGAGGNMTAQIFIEGWGNSGCDAPGSPVYIFNNVIGTSDGMSDNGLLNTSQGGGAVYNNTIVGPNNTQHGGDCFVYNATENSSASIAFQNNLLSTCNDLILGQTTGDGVFTSGSPNHNLYANGGTNSFNCNNSTYNFSQFAKWQSCIGDDTNSTAVANAELNSDDSPQAGSPALNAGANLTSTCNNLPTSPVNVSQALCTTYTGPPANGTAATTTPGTQRPTTGNWNAGAY